MPHGRKSPQSIERPPEIEEKAHAAIDGGGAFEMEMLNVHPGLPNVSITCAYEDDDIAHELAVNGPAVLVAIDSVIDQAYKIIVLREAPDLDNEEI